MICEESACDETQGQQEDSQSLNSSSHRNSKIILAVVVNTTNPDVLNLKRINASAFDFNAYDYVKLQ